MGVAVGGASVFLLYHTVHRHIVCHHLLHIPHPHSPSRALCPCPQLHWSLSLSIHKLHGDCLCCLTSSAHTLLHRYLLSSCFSYTLSCAVFGCPFSKSGDYNKCMET